MISAVRTNRQARAFTLIEIVVVLAIAAVLMGGAAGLMVYSSDERVLADASGEIELLAKRARITAILQQTPYAIEIRQGVVRMMPLALAGRDDTKTVGGHRIGGETEEPDGGDSREYSLDGGIEISVLRWNSQKWLETGEDSIHIWRFDPTGLCEPLSIRLAMENSWIEDSYHPLTATINDSQMEAR